METKVLSLLIVILLALAAFPVVQGGTEAGTDEDEDDFLLKVEGYHNPDPRWDGYCVNVTLAFGDLPWACVNSDILASVVPETGEITVEMPDLGTVPNQVPEEVWDVWNDVSWWVTSERRDLQREADLDSWLHETGLAPDLLPVLIDAACEPNKWGALNVFTGRRIVCEDMDLNVSRVHLEPTSMLVLRNTTLTFNIPTPTSRGHGGDSTFIIESQSGGWGDVRHPYHGGTFIMEDSRLLGSPDHRVRLLSDPDTVVRITDSKIRDFERVSIWGGSSVEGYGAREFSFINSTMKNGVGFNLGKTSVLVKNSYFEDVTWPVRTAGNVVFEGNSVTGCGSAVIGSEQALLIVMNNTITNCNSVIVHRNTDDCIPVRAHRNDFHGNHGWRIASFCGDARGNYWGAEPAPALFGHNPSGNGFSHDDVDYSEWSTEPFHPERLPYVSINMPDAADIGTEVSFDASDSRESSAFGHSLEAFEWKVESGSYSYWTYACDPQCERQEKPIFETKVGERISHVFQEMGETTVSLTVMDEKGFQRTMARVIDIQEPPPEPPLGPEKPDQPDGPLVNDVVIHPENPLEGQALDVMVDLDPKTQYSTITYTWYRDGKFHQEFHSAIGDQTGIPENKTQAGETWRVEVFVNTTRGTSDMGFTEVTILEREEGAENDGIPSDEGHNRDSHNEDKHSLGSEPRSHADNTLKSPVTPTSPDNGPTALQSLLQRLWTLFSSD